MRDLANAALDQGVVDRIGRRCGFRRGRNVDPARVGIGQVDTGNRR